MGGWREYSFYSTITLDLSGDKILSNKIVSITILKKLFHSVFVEKSNAIILLWMWTIPIPCPWEALTIFSLSLVCWNFVKIFCGMHIFHLLCWIFSGLFQCEDSYSSVLRNLIIYLISLTISFPLYFFLFFFYEVLFAISWGSWLSLESHVFSAFWFLILCFLFYFLGAHHTFFSSLLKFIIKFYLCYSIFNFRVLPFLI